MAELGFRSLDEMIGQTQYLQMDDAIKHWKNQGLDYSRMLVKPDVSPEIAIRRIQGQDHGLDKQLDHRLINLAAPALERKDPVTIELSIKNSNRTFGTNAFRYGSDHARS